MQRTEAPQGWSVRFAYPQLSGLGVTEPRWYRGRGGTNGAGGWNIALVLGRPQ